MTALAADFAAIAPGRRWPPGARNALLACAIASLLLHLLFVWVARPAAETTSRAAATAVAPSKVKLRLVAPPPPPPTATALATAPGPATVAPTPAAQQPSTASETTLQPLQKTETPSRRVAAVTPPTAVEATRTDTPSTAPTSDPTPSAPPATASSSALPITGAATPTGFEDYVARPLLTLAPAALAPVMIDPPPGNFGASRLVGVLALYIDEEGAVRLVEGNEPLLPALLEQAAREAFMAARFTPGEVDGRPVKSRIRIEVVFDNAPLK